MKRELCRLFAHLLAVFALPHCFASAAVMQQAKLNAVDAKAGQSFGNSVSLDGNYALIGNPANSASDAGAYVFKRTGSTWTQQQKLTPPKHSGISVSLSGSNALLGAVSAVDGFQGSAYIFHRDGAVWTQEPERTADDGAAADAFGQYVSIDRDVALIGSRLDDYDGLSNAGSAYVFRNTAMGWTQEQKLTPADAASEDNFGYSVSVSGDYALVGSVNDNALATGSGSAYVFHWDGIQWAQQAKLTATDAPIHDFTNDFFGTSVAIDGDTAVIGATETLGEAGAAYVFQRAGAVWTQTAKLTASNGGAGDIFGGSVSISGDLILVGARGEDGAGDALTNVGAAYLYRRIGANWMEVAKIAADDGSASDFFGISVSVSGTSALIGAYADATFGEDSGSAYVFVVPEPSAALLFLLGGLAIFTCRRRA